MNLFGGALGDDLPEVQDADALADAHDQLHVVLDLKRIQRSIRFFLYRKEGADADKKLSRYQRKGVDMLKKQKYVTAVFCHHRSNAEA